MDSLYSILNFDDGANTREITSPRSLEACLNAGIDPVELKRKNRERFQSNKKLTDEMVEKKFLAYERKRQGKYI